MPRKPAAAEAERTSIIDRNTLATAFDLVGIPSSKAHEVVQVLESKGVTLTMSGQIETGPVGTVVERQPGDEEPGEEDTDEDEQDEDA